MTETFLIDILGQLTHIIMLNGNRRRASYFSLHRPYSVRKLLQQPIDAWQFLQHLLNQSTAVKKANAPGLT